MPPLALLDPKHLIARTGEVAPGLTQVPAVMLFAQRATVKPDFVISAANAAALTWFWFFGNHMREARGWFASILAARATSGSDGGQGATAALAQALWGAGLMAIVESDYPAARTYLEESVAIGRQIADRSTLAVSLRELDLLELYQGNLAAADRYSEEGIALGQETGSKWDLGLAFLNAGYIASALGDNTRANAAFEKSRTLFQKVQDEWGIALALSGLGLVASQQGDYAAARAQLEASRTLWKGQSDKWSLGDVLCVLGEVLHRRVSLSRQGSYMPNACW